MKKLLFTSIAALFVAAPVFVPLAARACANPNADARADSAVFVMPAIPDGLGISGTSVIQVSLNDRGDWVSGTIFRSSGNAFLDDAALRSARMASYTPERRDCRSVAGTYLYEVEL